MTERPDIAVILESYGFQDVPTGYSWRNLRCEFHGDRNASAQVNTDTGFYRCFTCDFFGDGYEVIKWQEGVGFPEAKRRASAIPGAEHSSMGGEPAGGAGLPGKAWHNRGSGKGGKAGGSRYTGTYSR